MENKTTGNFGEKLAYDYLIKTGYKILETNFTTRIGEIDLIVEKEDIIAFVEVKARKNLKYGMPCEAVNSRKMQKIIRVAENYIAYRGKEDRQYRFDVIEVFLGEEGKINHIEDAFWL